MDLEQLRDLLLSKVREVNPRGANKIVGDILSAFPHAEIAEYAEGSDEQIRSLIAETEKRMKGPEFSNGKPGLKSCIRRKSAVEHELKNGSDPGIDTEKSSVTITPYMVSPVSHNLPLRSQRALDGSPHVSDGLGGLSAYEHLQSSSTPDADVPDCSNATRYTPSSSRLTIDPCHYFTTPAFYDNGFQFSHGFGPLGRLEMDIRRFLQDKPLGIRVADLPRNYFERYSWFVQGEEWSPISLLERLHTTRMLTDRLGHYWINLLENDLALKHLERVISAGSGSRNIFFSGADGRSLTPKHVSDYFSKYGPVNGVTIPNRERRTFGFVNFKYPDSVGLLLSEWCPHVPHSIFFKNGPHSFREAKVFVKCYNDKAKPSNSSEEHMLKNGYDPGIATEKSSVTMTPDMASQVTHGTPSQRALEGEVVTGSPNVPDGPSANEHEQDITVLPDEEECFYNLI